MARPDMRIVPSTVPAERSTRQVAAEFRSLLANGASLQPAGEARDDPAAKLLRRYGPRFRLDLFGTRFYLAAVRQNPAIRFFVAYIVAPDNGAGVKVYPRILYKDISLVWRTASHMIASDREFWIGKGDVRTVVEDGDEVTYSVESTTDLPLELQAALEDLNHQSTHVREDEIALYLILRSAPDGRIEPYRDFLDPRRKAIEAGFAINGGRPVARFTRRNDPTSLRFVRGFEPDFKGGVLERTESRSKLYGGRLYRYRILSANRRIQYMFFAGPRHVWIIPPQATTTELSSYGLRTVDVPADEDVFVPGYEYHYLEDEDDPSSLVSQIPEGFAGPNNPLDPDRADASPWIERLPIVQEFRRVVLRRKAPRWLGLG